MRAAEFFNHLHSGIEVALALTSPSPDKVFGVREGFQRFFDQALNRHLPITLKQTHLASETLPMSSPETLDQTRQRALAAEEWVAGHGAGHVFSVGSESGLTVISSGGETRYLVDHWTVVRGLGEEAWGSSGCVQIPQELIAGGEGEPTGVSVVPGTRRSGGMASSLTGGSVTRRSAASQSTFHALCSLFYGRLRVQPRG